MVTGPRNLLFSVILLIASGGTAVANDIYVAQNAQGANTGSDCSNAHPYTYFSSLGNWGSGSGQIGPGTTVHVCGTITGGNGENMFTFQGSGSSGNPVTLKWEDGAVVQAPYVSGGGGIVASGKSWITIDGGTNGILRNTLNGTPGAACPGGSCNFQIDDVMISLAQCTNTTVKNLEIGPVYYRTSTSDGSGGGAAIFLDNSSSSGAINVLIQGNKMHDAFKGLFNFYGTNQSGLEESSNEVYRTNWGLAHGASSNGRTITGVSVHDNNLHDFVNWDDFPSPYHNHHDAVFFFGGQTGNAISGCYVYRNYFHGDFGAGTAPALYLDNVSDGTFSCTAFNNLIAYTTAGPGGDGAFTAQDESGSGPVIFNAYNNTVVISNGSGPTGFWLSGSNVTADLRNNITGGWVYDLFVTNGASVPATSDFNDWSAANTALLKNGSTEYSTLAAWQSATGKDASSISANPNLDANYKLQATSPAIGKGTNLTSLCQGVMTALCTDKAGIARPASGSWDMGAYQSVSATAPKPPTGLTVVVH